MLFCYTFNNSSSLRQQPTKTEKTMLKMLLHEEIQNWSHGVLKSNKNRVSLISNSNSFFGFIKKNIKIDNLYIPEIKATLFCNRFEGLI